MRYREEAPLLLAFALAYIPDADSLVPSTPVHVPPTLSGSTRCGCGTGDPPTSGDFCWSSSGDDRQGRYNNRRRSSSLLPATALAGEASAWGTGASAASLARSREAVSCLRNNELGSEIWLVGCYHRGKDSVELVQEVIRTVQPTVVMVELDARRARLLPTGDSDETEDGLCWWRPDRQSLEDLQKRKVGKRKAVLGNERGEQGVEFYTAAVEAQGCGARVLLGDRDLEETLRRQAEAKRADEEEAAAKPSDKRRRAGLDMEKLEGLIARRSALGQEAPVTREIMRKWSAAMKRLRPKEHAANVTERDEVMTENLAKLKAETTVAVVGFGHLDGIESILKATGWESPSFS